MPTPPSHCVPPARHSRRTFLRAAALASGAALLPGALIKAAAQSRQPPRSIVFILADDLGWADPTCYGSRMFETPNIDRLAAMGMRFTDAYAAAPVCSPTRASIMTGRYPARIGLTEWIPGKRSTPRERVVAPPSLQHMPLPENTIPELLRAGGYVCGHVGKWHLGGTGHLPEDQGFHTNIGGTHHGSPAGGYFLPNRMNLQNMEQGDYLTDRLSREGAAFIEVNADRPFFLYQSYHSVHTPIQSKPEYAARFARKAEAAGVTINALYAGMIQSLDEGVGLLLDALEARNLMARTAVIFMSDNGGLQRVTDNAPLRAGKGHIYEGGIREPMIVCAPGLVPPGSSCSKPVTSVDFLPTILDLAGLPAPKDLLLDGVSLMPLLTGGGDLARDAVFWHYPHYSPQGGRPGGAVRNGPLKLIEFFDDGSLELYNLAEDIGETSNLAAAMPAQTAALQARLKTWRAAVGARMPTPNPTYGAAPAKATLPNGDLDDQFDVLTNCAVDPCDLGYAVRSTRSGGMALKKLPTPLRHRCMLSCRLQSLQSDRSLGAWRNAFLVVGDPAHPDSLVNAGLYLGGRRQIALVQGTANGGGARAEVELEADPYTVFELHMTVDFEAQTVVLLAAGKRVELALAKPLPHITHIGYATVNTVTAFSDISISP